MSVVGVIVAVTVGFFLVTPVDAATPSATLVVAPQSPTASPSSQIAISVVVHNTSSKRLTNLEVDFSVNNNALTSGSDLNAWLSGKNGGTLPGRSVGILPLEAIDAGRSTTATFTMPASALGAAQQWGAHGIAARVISSTTTLASARTSVALLAGAAPRVLKLTTILPMSASPSALGLTTKAELAEATSATGYLTELLVASKRYEVAIAVDPKISTSILAAGSDAPVSATNWLANLSTTARDGFWLGYGDSDFMGQIQAGAAAPIVPSVSDISGIGPLAPTPSPTGLAPNSTQPPAWAGWNPSIDDIAWPMSNTVASTSELNQLGALNYHKVLLASGNLAAATQGQTRVNAGAWASVTVDDSVSACLGSAQRAVAQIVVDVNMACAMSYLAASVTDPRANSTILASLSRIMPTLTALSSASDLLAQMYTQSWIQPMKLSALLALPATVAEISPKPESASRIALIKSLQANQSRVLGFSAATKSPDLIVNPGERRLAAALSAGWANTDSWLGGVAANTALTAEVLNSVSIVSSSPINMVGGQARIPVVVRNDLDAPVNIVVHAEPSNGRLVVDGNINLTVEANSQNRAYLPVSARVGSGSVDLKITLTDTAGHVIGTTQTLPVRVRADWEVWGLLGIGIIFIGLITAGVIRTMRKRKGRALD